MHESVQRFRRRSPPARCACDDRRECRASALHPINESRLAWRTHPKLRGMQERRAARSPPTVRGDAGANGRTDAARLSESQLLRCCGRRSSTQRSNGLHRTNRDVGSTGASGRSAARRAGRHDMDAPRSPRRRATCIRLIRRGTATRRRPHPRRRRSYSPARGSR